jgi:hypothetical protein
MTHTWPLYHEKPLRYEIYVQGHLDESYSDWLEGFSLDHEVRGDKPVTVLSGFLPDQAALYGILNKLYALGLPLLEVKGLES